MGTPAPDTARCGPDTALVAGRSADVLAWTDYCWAGRAGVPCYRDERITQVQDLDIVTVESLLQVLEIVPAAAIGERAPVSGDGEGAYVSVNRCFGENLRFNHPEGLSRS